MATSEERKIALARADAILALEGFVKTPDLTRLQQAVIDGRVTFDQAVRSIIESVKSGEEGDL
jgi:hypothetical protein